METEGKRILVNYLTDIADTFRSITGETDTISAESFSKFIFKLLWSYICTGIRYV